MPDRILIVEDESKLAALLRDYLVQEGFEVSMLHRGDEVEPWMAEHDVDLVLLDLMLPGKNGLDVCRALRARGDVAIVMVTARVEEIDRLLGLELGADDYICKPFSAREVVARVKAILRRVKRGGRPTEVGVKLDDDGHRATIGGRDLNLTAVEFQLLTVLSGRACRRRPHGRQSHQEDPSQDCCRPARPRDRALGLRLGLQVRMVDLDEKLRSKRGEKNR